MLERFASESFEKGWIADGQIEKFDEVADAVRRVVAQERHASTKHVVMAMPQSAVITKKIMLPAGLREEELELQVEIRSQSVHPVLSRRGQPRLLRHRSRVRHRLATSRC